MSDSYDDVRARLEASIRLGIAAEDGWDGPSIKPGDLTDDQITWLASWLAGDGCDKAWRPVPPHPQAARTGGAMTDRMENPHRDAVITNVKGE